MLNHSLLPSIRGASLPAKYEAARVAIQECNKVDECKDWADKSAALASYAKQSQDKEMEKLAMRIRARAIQRCGELLGEIEAKRGGGRKSKGRHVPIDRKSAAEDAGLSPDQAKDAIRIASIPKNLFDEQVDGEDPPTITALADQGTKKAKPIYEQQGMTKQAFQAGMHVSGAMASYLKRISEYDPQDVVDGSTAKEREAIRRNIELIDKYHDRVNSKL